MVGLSEQFLRYRDRGDVAALAAVFDATVARLSSLALMLSGNPADAEDLVQGTFLVAIRKSAQFDAQRPLLPWLCGILEGEASNLRRSRRRARTEHLPDLCCTAAGPPAATERRELVAALRSHVTALPGPQRQVLLLQLQHGLQPVEVAEVLGLAPGTVRMRIHRGLEALRRMLPVGLATLFASMLATRGIAAVRREVLRVGAREVVVGGALGGIMAKKLVLLSVFLLVASLGWFGVQTWAGAAAPTRTCSPPPLAQADLGGDPGGAQPTAAPVVEPASLPRTPVVAPDVAPAAVATGSLLLRIVRYETHEPMVMATAVVTPCASGVDRALTRRTVTTAAHGEVTVTGLPAGDIEIQAFCGTRQQASIAAGRQTVVEAEIMTGNPAHGQVVLPDGRPAVGATIVLSSDGNVFTAGVTDQAGRFALDAVYPFHLVGARLAGYAPSGLHGLDPERELRIELPGPAAALVGSVVDRTGRGIVGARVLVGSERSPAQWQGADGLPIVRGGDGVVATDDRGAFTFDASPGPVRVRVLAAGFAPAERVLDAVAGVGNRLAFTLERSAPLRGRVVDGDGVPVGGVSVRLGGESGPVQQTTVDGDFAFDGVAAGPQVISCEHPSIVTLHAERAAADSGTWLLVVQRLPRWQLRFVDELSAPLAHWGVRCGGASLIENTDELGRVELHAPLADRGRLELFHWKRRFTIDWPPDAMPDVESTVVVAAARQVSATIRGRVVDAGGIVVADAIVGLQDPGGGLRAETRTAAAEIREQMEPTDGRFEFAVGAGDHVIVVRRDGAAPAARFVVDQLRAGEGRDLGDLRLPPQGSLAFRLSLPAGGMPSDVRIDVVGAGGDVASLSWLDDTPRAWPIGRYSFTVRASDALRATGAFEVTAAQLTVCDLVLTPAVRQRLRFPVPVPDWGAPESVHYELVAPDGVVGDDGEFDPRLELPRQLDVPLTAGDWQLRLRLGDGRQFCGTARIDALAPAGTTTTLVVLPTK